MTIVDHIMVIVIITSFFLNLWIERKNRKEIRRILLKNNIYCGPNNHLYQMNEYLLFLDQALESVDSHIEDDNKKGKK